MPVHFRSRNEDEERRAIARRGAEGWEAFGVIPLVSPRGPDVGSGTDGFMLFFKRRARIVGERQ
jgi:hypothetical protein